MSNTADELELVKGSSLAFDVELYGSNDQPLDLTLCTEATLAMRKTLSSANSLLRRSIAPDLNLTIDQANKKLRATLTQPEADALVKGSYVCDVALKIDGKWVHADLFDVTVLDSFAPHSS